MSLFFNQLLLNLIANLINQRQVSTTQSVILIIEIMNFFIAIISIEVKVTHQTVFGKSSTLARNTAGQYQFYFILNTFKVLNHCIKATLFSLRSRSQNFKELSKNCPQTVHELYNHNYITINIDKCLCHDNLKKKSKLE